jgi:hypothetical protein
MCEEQLLKSCRLGAHQLDIGELFKDALGDLGGLAHCLESSTRNHVGIIEKDWVIHVAAFPPLLFVLMKRTKPHKMCTALTA